MVSKNDQSQNEYNSAKGQERWAERYKKMKNVGLDSVQHTMARLGLADAGNIRYLEGFIENTLPEWGVQEISFLRIGVDIYAATYDALHYLYPRLSQGGAVLFDNWKFPYSREAILVYRKEHNITTPVEFLPGTVDPMAYWIKE